MVLARTARTARPSRVVLGRNLGLYPRHRMSHIESSTHDFTTGSCLRLKYREGSQGVIVTAWAGWHSLGGLAQPGRAGTARRFVLSPLNPTPGGRVVHDVATRPPGAWRGVANGSARAGFPEFPPPPTARALKRIAIAIATP